MGYQAPMQELTMLEWCSDGKYKVIKWVTGRIAGYERIREKIPGRKKGTTYRLLWRKYSEFDSMEKAYAWFREQTIRASV